MYPDMSTEMSSFRTAARELLFVYDFDLLVDYLAGEAIDRDVHPVMLLAFNEEACKTRSIGRIAAALRDHIDQQVPRSGLICFTERTRDRLTLCLWHGRPQSCFVRDQSC